MFGHLYVSLLIGSKCANNFIIGQCNHLAIVFFNQFGLVSEVVFELTMNNRIQHIM